MGAEKTKQKGKGRKKKLTQTVQDNKTVGKQTGDVMDVAVVVLRGLQLKSNNVIKLCYSRKERKD